MLGAIFGVMVAVLVIFKPLVQRMTDRAVRNAEAHPKRSAQAQSKRPTAASAPFEPTALEPLDFEQHRADLVLQLIPHHYVPELREHMVQWTLAEGLACMLCINRGATERTVNHTQITHWPIDSEALRTLARRNAVGRAIVQDVQSFHLTTPDQVPLCSLLSTQANFAMAFALENLVQFSEPVVFGVPNWCNALMRNVDSTLSTAIVLQLAQMMAERCETSARPGVPGLYWHADGRFEKVDIEGGKILGPAALCEHLSTLD